MSDDAGDYRSHRGSGVQIYSAPPSSCTSGGLLGGFRYGWGFAPWLRRSGSSFDRGDGCRDSACPRPVPGALLLKSRSEEVQTVRGGWCQVSRVRSTWEVGRHGDDTQETGHQSSCGRGWPGGVGGGANRKPPRAGGPARGGLRFAFYGRVSTEDWQDPVTSLARQYEQAQALVRGHGVIAAEFFDAGQSRTVAWGRRPRAAALIAQLADPGRGWDAIVVGEYERAFYGSQYAAMAPLFEHYGVQLWMPEAGGRVDFASEHDEQAMTVLGLSSKREVSRTSIRVRTAMAVQAREQGRYLGGRPPYGYRLADAGPHPNKAHAGWGRRAHRLDPDPETAHVVRWVFAQRLAGHSVARIARALNDLTCDKIGGLEGGRVADLRGFMVVWADLRTNPAVGWPGAVCPDGEGAPVTEGHPPPSPSAPRRRTGPAWRGGRS